MKEKNIVAEEVYELEISEEQIRFELFKVIQNNFVINKCENCGRLFIPITSSNNSNQKGRNDQKYCKEITGSGTTGRYRLRFHRCPGARARLRY